MDVPPPAPITPLPPADAVAPPLPLFAPELGPLQAQEALQAAIAP
jgi:hypothetical protein